MNLNELQREVENAIRAAYEHGENPEVVMVTLQVDDPEDPHHGYACGTTHASTVKASVSRGASAALRTTRVVAPSHLMALRRTP